MKTEQGHYRFDKDTADTIEKKAASIGVSKTEYITRLVHSDNIPIEKDLLQKIYREISAIGNNINQIAHKANMNMYDVNDIEKIEEFKISLYEFKYEISKVRKKF